jgi:NTE family protein
MTKPASISVILAGAVAKGAFEAGALQVIAERGIPVRRIVAASSGALNGAVYAAGVRARDERAAAAEMVTLWRDKGDWGDAVHMSLGHFLMGDGIADGKNLLLQLRQHVRPPRNAEAERAPIDLRILVAPLDGGDGAIGTARATTYERVLAFKDGAFDTRAGLEEVFRAAVASAAFPIVFAPVDVPGVGACLDGGVVNNTPVDYALDGGRDQEVEAVVVISPTPEIVPPHQGPYTGLDLLSQLVDVLINERLYRDLRRAEATNDVLAKLRGVAGARGWDADTVEAIKQTVDLAGKREIPIVRIRPLDTLPGNAFSGFLDRGAREAYLDAGTARAEQVLDGLGWG